MNPQLDSFGRDYLRLVLEIHAHHVDGYVDAYYGPPALKAEIEAAGPKTPRELLAAVHDLQQRIRVAGHRMYGAHAQRRNGRLPE
mgnify:CR=1 FL=1